MIKKIIFCHIPSILSIFFVFLYFTPWLYDAHKFMGIYILAYLWFLISPIFFIIKLIHIIINKKTQFPNFLKHQIISMTSIVLFQLTIIIGMSKGYILTV